MLDRIACSRSNFEASDPTASHYRAFGSRVSYYDEDARHRAHAFRNFSAGLEALDVAPKGGGGGFVLDALLIVSGWVLFIGLIAYPQAQLAGILGCAIALFASRKQRSAKQARAWNEKVWNEKVWN